MRNIKGSPSLRTLLLKVKVKTRVQISSAFSSAVESDQLLLSVLLPQDTDNFYLSLFIQTDNMKGRGRNSIHMLQDTEWLNQIKPKTAINFCSRSLKFIEALEHPLAWGAISLFDTVYVFLPSYNLIQNRLQMWV